MGEEKHRILRKDAKRLRKAQQNIQDESEAFDKWVEERCEGEENCYRDQLLERFQTPDGPATIDNTLSGKIVGDDGVVRRTSDKFREDARKEFLKVVDARKTLIRLRDRLAQAYGTYYDLLDVSTGEIKDGDVKTIEPRYDEESGEPLELEEESPAPKEEKKDEEKKEPEKK